MSDIVAIYVPINKKGHYTTEDTEVAAYYMGYIFDDNGSIGATEIERTYREFFNSNKVSCVGNYIGPFAGIDEVHKYSFYLCQSLEAEGIGLIPIDKYNNLLTKAHTTSQLKELLPKHYEYIKNIDHNKKSLFNRIFS